MRLENSMKKSLMVVSLLLVMAASIVFAPAKVAPTVKAQDDFCTGAGSACDGYARGIEASCRANGGSVGVCDFQYDQAYAQCMGWHGSPIIMAQ
jgi:uncharacterized membrane protein